MTTVGGRRLGVALFDEPREYAALVRLSRGAGLPRGWPDVLGVAVRIRDGGGPGRDLDLLFSTAAGAVPLLRQVPFPRRSPVTFYSSVAGYRTARGRYYLAALPWPGVGPEQGFRIAAARRFGRWRTVALVTLGAPVPAAVDRAVGFDAVRHAAPGLDPDGWLWGVRRAAYGGSRRGRDPVAPVEDEPGDAPTRWRVRPVTRNR
ncbi:hypothetical protein O7635_23445 [Asanoa sp. WMMD1127]|uniref:hypothetical protein n=1 Tax=Asanoa sp. WMMD1127 TaxID=3016107 RepID=UPI002415A493|nr:hypothetical protein [Asanoa sp. WMMD1127]MDG4824815.1 hypothetical protein [Asanoa sp. WMMD1127]